MIPPSMPTRHGSWQSRNFISPWSPSSLPITNAACPMADLTGNHARRIAVIAEAIRDTLAELDASAPDAIEAIYHVAVLTMLEDEADMRAHEQAYEKQSSILPP